MTDRDLDRILARGSEIVPSSGFTARVMGVVRRDAVTPPIPFPWKRAIPGLAAAVLIVVCFAVFFTAPGPAVSYSLPRLSSIFDSMRFLGAGWIALALLASAAAVKFAKLLA
jgi:hypothetical protein